MKACLASRFMPRGISFHSRTKRELMSTGLSWGALIVAGVLEIAFAIALKSSQGLSRPGWAALSLAALIASVMLLSLALRQLPVGTAYAVWTGIGAAGTAIVGIAVLGDPASLARLACLALILGGVIGLRAVS
jgi:quaternary ammonium compound-resistance protein SugE